MIPSVIIINLSHLRLKTPHDKVSIKWEVDGSSGSTECEAWRGQHEIDKLTAAGYKITFIERAL